MGKQLTMKAWKSSYNLHFCLDRSLIWKCRNLYWVETSEQQESLQEVKYPFGWKTNAVTAWDPSLHTLDKLNLLIQQILRSTEASSSTLNMVLTHFLCCIFITETSRNSDSSSFILHYSHPTIQRLQCYPGQINFSRQNLNIWLVVQWIIWYDIWSQSDLVEAPHKRKGRLWNKIKILRVKKAQRWRKIKTL